MRTTTRPKAWELPLVFCLAATAACTGTISGSGGGAGAAPAHDHPGDESGAATIPDGFVGPTSGGGGAGETAAAIVPGPTALRRLTNDEYRNTMKDLVGTVPDVALQKETRSNGYDNFASALSVSTTLAGQYEEIAVALAAEADVAKLAPCSSSHDEETCAGSFIKSFGKRAFRRPLTSDEETAYRALYTVGRKDGSYAEGIKTVLEAFLASPYLLYRFELGTPAAGDKRVLNPYELATELSYFLTGTMPDAELFAAADDGRLTTPAEVAQHARRLIASSKARSTVPKLFIQWFGIASLSTVNKDPDVYPSFNPELRTAMADESERFVDHMLWERDGTLSALLTSPTTFVNSALAKLYGIADPGGAALVERDLDPTQRAGLLTHASVLSEHSHAGDSFPIARGKFVRKSLLCQALPPPPPSVMLTPPPPQPDRTTRERFAQHSENPSCASCHALIDPLGFGLENYDGIGAYRTQENGKPIDASGELIGTVDADGPYAGGVELAKKLASSRTTSECAVVQTMRWAYGRLESESDRALAASLAQRLGRGNMDFRELLVTLTMTESFFVRTPAQ